MDIITGKNRGPKNFFKGAHSLEDRISSCKKILGRNPDRIPVIVISPKDIILDKYKYLVPHDTSVGQFMYILRKRVNISAEQSLFLFVNETLPPASSLMSVIYAEHKDEDGYIYMYLMKEATFGEL